MEAPRWVVIAGPTASGKSALALEVAERCDGEVVNADSRQIYRYLDIGTAKPTAAQRARVAHHLFDVALPDERFDAARYRDLARTAVLDAAARGQASRVRKSDRLAGRDPRATGSPAHQRRDFH